MSRLRLSTPFVVGILAAALLVGGAPAPTTRAATPDPSDVVLVLDFSASILNDKANRDRFAAALDRIADRVDATSADLVAGDATVTIVQFAAKAADYAGCADLRLLDSPETVAALADCLRSVAGAYRKGLDPALTQKIGIDTNYVAAMEQAAKHLPASALRPALILFTDGKHDVKGIPVSRVQTTLDQLFGKRTPFALLPVGMGLEAGDRGALEAGLAKMRTLRQMPACVSGSTFDWPQVVFQSADDAGNAVAVALQDATCTFTVAAAPTPGPSTAPALGAVRAIRLTARDGKVELTWVGAPVVEGTPAVVDYKVRCRPSDGTGDWVESAEGVSLDRKTTVDGLTNGTAYTCEIAAVGATGDGPWTPAGKAVTPSGPPAAPAKPSVQALNQAVAITVAAADPKTISGYRYECSGDQGATWPAGVDAGTDGSGHIPDLTNGQDYVCRAFAVSDIGQSDASPLSDAVRPCGSTLECTPILAPIVGGVGLLILLGFIAVAVALVRGRGKRGYVVAVVDVVHTTNLGYGRNLGMTFVFAADARRVSDVVADPGKTADAQIRRIGRDRFVVTDRHGKHDATVGQPIVVTDSVGGRHEVVLRAFNTTSAAAVSTRS